MKKIKEINISDKQYPELLKNIKKPPSKLYVMGNIDILNEKAIAIVGSRKATSKGEKIAKSISRDTSLQGINTISGMALGIDSAVHIGTIEAGGKTIAVLGSGFNKIFPEENKKLFKTIINTGGAVVTEYSPNTSWCSENFRQRNRIVSGLSIGVLVIEAAYRSGTAITVQYAKKQNKKVFCIPHEIDNKNGIGTNKFIREGAILVSNIEEIMQEYGQYEVKKDLKIKQLKNIQKIKIEKEYKKLYDIITEIPINIEEVVKKSKENISEANSKLLIMELKGYIKQLPGNYYIRKGDEWIIQKA